MFKKVLIKVIIVTMLVTIMTSGYVFGLDPYERDGFRLVVEEYDSTGIGVNTGFVLGTEKDFTLQQIQKGFSIDGEPAPIIEELDPNFFSIKLSRPLLENSIYTFRMKAEKETTWVFQTQTSFKVESSIPANKAINVPINTGIEINFSHEGFTDYENLFEINPKAQGKFEVHKKTLVFVPEELQYATIYTIRLKKGVKLSGGDRKIEEDFIFSFETQPKVTSTPQPQQPVLNMGFGRYLYDFSSEDQPGIKLSYYASNYKQETVVTLDNVVYAYKDFSSFLEAVKLKNQVPTWAQANSQNNFIPVDNLQKVLEFKEEIIVANYSSSTKTMLIPQKLPVGYYILEGKYENKRLQTFIQVTDTATYITKSKTKTIVWLNDINTKKPVSDAKVTFSDSNKTYYTGVDGVAQFDTPVKNLSEESDSYYPYYYRYIIENHFLIVTTKEGKSSLLDVYSYGGSINSYWKYFFTDRNMYKPTDTVSLWGFIENRYTDEKIDSLTLEISNGYRYSYMYGSGYSSSLPVIKKTIDVVNGFYEANIKLPNLPQGYYSINIKKGDISVVNSYINVEEYVKPAYKIDVSKDKEAIFLGEEVNFGIKAGFFEGTGVSNLNVNYEISQYNIGNTIVKQDKTDIKGELNVKYVPSLPVSSSVQGQTSANFFARALLPESGQISSSNSVRVFINDINVNTNGTTKDGKGTITSKVNKIVLDRLNNGTATGYSDYLGAPVNGKKIDGVIYKNTWIKTESGTYYDYINKVTYKSYTYNLKKEPIKEFSMSTNSNGEATFNFDAPEIQDSYYTANINSIDGNGRKMTFEIYIGKRYDYSSYTSTPYYRLVGNQDSYGLNEEVTVTYKYGVDPLPKAGYLYIRSSGGIFDYAYSENSEYKYKFTNRDVPNTEVRGIYFNGLKYIVNSYNAMYRIDEKKLNIKAKTDKESYRPGEEAVINIDITDENNKPVKSTVNLSIVDEAFFKLSDQKVDVLGTLYAQVSSGRYSETLSHDQNGTYNAYPRSWYTDGVMPTPAAAGGGENSKASTDVREDFKDTAKFVSLTTDQYGRGQLRFKLPDNVTAWRVTMSAISEELHGGSDTINMNVTLPFFINYSFNTSYLVGDVPVIGVNAYGNGLKENEDVIFEVSNSNKMMKAEGKAFERVNIPLWALEEGKQDIIIRASTKSGYTDAIKHTINVVNSYYEVEKADYYDLVSGMSIPGDKKGFTKLIFQDKSKGKYLQHIVGNYYTSGNRIDQKLSGYMARQLLLKYFPDILFISGDGNLSLKEYQQGDGGLSLLPYTESDIDISAKLAPFVKEMVNTQSLKNYFYQKMESSILVGKIKALYGLAALKEPVLLKINEMARLDNLSVEDLVYLSLAYYEIGDTTAAKDIYDNRITPRIEKFDPYYRVNSGNDKDDILKVTSICAYLAAKLDAPQKEGLFGYCVRNYATDILLSSEKLMYIGSEIGKASQENSKFTYSVNDVENTVELKGSSFTLSLLPSQLEALKISKVEGDISVVSVYKTSAFDMTKVDPEITINRTYHLTTGEQITSNKFKQGDVVKVRLSWDMSDKAFDGTYEITDYLPSGLVPYNTYMDSDGQKVRFYIYNSSYWNQRNYVEYNARVVSPGTYTAQGPSIQGKTSRDNINFGKSQTFVIDPNGTITNPVEVTPPPKPTPDDGIKIGDANKDGKIDSTDYAWMKRYVLDIVKELPVPKEKVDLNGDGTVDSTDMAIMKRYLLAMITKFPVSK